MTPRRPGSIGRSSCCRAAVATGHVNATGHLPDNDRTVNKMRHRSPEAQARNAEMERARKKRLRDGKLKEEAQNVNGEASGPQLVSGSPPGATAQEEKAQSNLTRGAGYDTTNNMNLFLTQCCGCSNPVRNKKTLFDLLIQQITSLEQHGILDRLEGQPLRPWRARPERLATFSQRITNAELEVRGGKNPALWRVGCVADRLAPRRSAASPAPGHATSAAKKLTL